MQTSIGLFPQRNKAFMQIVNNMADEGLYDSYFHDNQPSRKHLTVTVAENIGTAYEQLLRHDNCVTQDMEGIISLANKQSYNERTWGPNYKSREINIIDNASEDDFKAMSGGITTDKIQQQSTLVKEMEDIFEVADKVLDIEANLRSMRVLQDFFLVTERLDFRELLRNTFQETGVHQEGEERLLQLITDYRHKLKDTLVDYLYYRTNELIPDEYKESLF